MWFASTPKPPRTLDQDFITRYWDLVGRVDKMEAHLDDILEEVQRRYKRAEQSERRLDEKRERSPCDDEQEVPENRTSVFDIARRAIDGSA